MCNFILTKLLCRTFLLLFFFAPLTHAQVTLEWVARYDGPSGFSEYVSAMALDSNGNVYVTGTDSEEPPGFVTIKFDANGQFVWARRYSGGMSIMATPKLIEVDLQCNVYVGASDVDYIIIKYDSNGVQQWVKRYRGSGGGGHEIKDLILDNDENVYALATGSVSNIGTERDVGTVKYNSSGDTVWIRNYSNLIDIMEWPSSMDSYDFTRLNIAGKTETYPFSPMDFLTLSYDLDGTLRWARTWNGPGNMWDVAYDVAVDKNGNTYVTGYAQMDSTFDEDIVTIKYDSNGNEKWVRFYDGPADSFSYDYGRFVRADPFGNIIVSGVENGQFTYGDFCTIKYDSLGNQLWHRTYNGVANRSDYVEGLAVDKYGDIYLIGTVDETSNLHKITTIKYDKDGNQIWLQKYPDGDTISGPKAIIVDKNLNVYIAGEIGTAGYNSDIIVLKYLQPTRVGQIKNDIPEGFKLYQNYPNPFNPRTDLRFEIRDLSHVTLKIYDVFGREVAMLVNEKKEAGEYDVEWNASTSSWQALASGVYYYRLTVYNPKIGGRAETKKMVYIK